MQYSLGVALLIVSQAGSGYLFRESHPDMKIFYINGVFRTGDTEDESAFLATEEQEGSLDWVVNS